MAKGRPKGNRAELEVAAIIEPWWSPYEKGCRFKRTPLSGGWGDRDVRGAFNASGDLMTTAKRFPFCVEVKRRENWKLHQLEAGKRSPVWRWWRQTQEAASECSLEPMMWFRQNRRPWVVMLREFFALRLTPCPRPVMTWNTLDVDVGDAHPIVLAASDLLALSPKHIVACARVSGVV
jgi:hypothetical protein